MSNREKAEKGDVLRNEAVAVAEKTVTIPEMEYNSLLAAAELVGHPDVLLRTLAAIGRPRGESLEAAFGETESSHEEDPKKGGLKSA